MSCPFGTQVSFCACAEFVLPSAFVLEKAAPMKNIHVTHVACTTEWGVSLGSHCEAPAPSLKDMGGTVHLVRNKKRYQSCYKGQEP